MLFTGVLHVPGLVYVTMFQLKMSHFCVSVSEMLCVGAVFRKVAFPPVQPDSGFNLCGWFIQSRP